MDGGAQRLSLFEVQGRVVFAQHHPRHREISLQVVRRDDARDRVKQINLRDDAPIAPTDQIGASFSWATFWHSLSSSLYERPPAKNERASLVGLVLAVPCAHKQERHKACRRVWGPPPIPVSAPQGPSQGWRRKTVNDRPESFASREISSRSLPISSTPCRTSRSSPVQARCGLDIRGVARINDDRVHRVRMGASSRSTSRVNTTGMKVCAPAPSAAKHQAYRTPERDRGRQPALAAAIPKQLREEGQRLFGRVRSDHGRSIGWFGQA